MPKNDAMPVHTLMPLSLERGRAFSEAATLFIQRGRTAQPRFEPTAVERAVVEEIATRLDGIPFALEVVAARLAAIGLRDLANTRDELDEIALSIDDQVPPHQRGVRTCLEWTWNLCSTDLREAWAALALFEGPFSAEAATSLLELPGGLSETLDVLDTLRENSILHTSGRDGLLQYRMLGLARRFGTGRLAPERESRLSSHIVEYAIAFCRSATGEFVSPAQLTWLRLSRGELSTIRTAVEAALRSPVLSHAVVAILTEAFYSVWWSNGLTLEVAYWHRRVLLTGPDDAVTRCYSLSAAGVASRVIPEMRGDEYFSEALAISATLDDAALSFHVDVHRAVASLLDGQFEDALRIFRSRAERESLAMNKHLHLQLLQVAADASDALGLGADAARFAREMLLIVEPEGEAIYRSLALRVLAMGMWRRGELDDALEVARQGIALSAAGGSPAAFIACVQAVALIIAARGDDERAAVLLGAVRAAQDAIVAAKTVLARTGEMAEVLQALEGRLGQTRYRELMEAGAFVTRSYVVQLASGGPFDSDGIVAPPAPDRAPPSVLTRREWEVAGLVAEGQSNAAIASALFLSRRTVEGHVERALRKLGLTSRTQLAAWVHAQAT